MDLCCTRLQGISPIWKPAEAGGKIVTVTLTSGYLSWLACGDGDGGVSAEKILDSQVQSV